MKASFINSLSSFWKRFFRDSADVEALMEAEAELVGQTYLNLLSDVLNVGVKDTPLFNREYFKLLTVREDTLRYRDTGDLTTSKWVLETAERYGALPQLQNKVLAADAALEETLDYEVLDGELRFNANITDPVLDGFATRRIGVTTGGTFTSASVTDWSAGGVKNGDTLVASRYHDVTKALVFSDSLVNFTDPGIAAGCKVILNGVTYTIAAVVSAKHITLTTAHKINEQLENVSVVVTNALGTTVYYNGDAAVALPDLVERYTVTLLRTGVMYLESTTPAPTDFLTGYYWKVHRNLTDGSAVAGLPTGTTANGIFTAAGATVTVNEVSLWAINAMVDQYNLYETYGYLFTDKTASSEAYRAFLRGLMQLYVYGPSFERLESGLNAVADLPLIENDGELLTGYDSGRDTSGVGDGTLSAGNIFTLPAPFLGASAAGGKIWLPSATNQVNKGLFTIKEVLSSTQVELDSAWPMSAETGLDWVFSGSGFATVSTDNKAYRYPFQLNARADIADPASIGVLTFRAFESLTESIQVQDYVQYPEWWFNTIVPPEVLPDESTTRRVVSTNVYPNTYGGENGQAHYGDPGLFYGTDEEGNVTASPHHHNAAFWYMDRFLKYHMFRVELDFNLDLTGSLIPDLQALTRAVKPAHTYASLGSLATFADAVLLTDETLDYGARLELTTESLAPLPNPLTYDGTWTYGDKWEFDGPSGGDIVVWPAPGVAGTIALCYGGSDPRINNPPGAGATLDRALFAYAHV